MGNGVVHSMGGGCGDCCGRAWLSFAEVWPYYHAVYIHNSATAFLARKHTNAFFRRRPIV